MRPQAGKRLIHPKPKLFIPSLWSKTSPRIASCPPPCRRLSLFYSSILMSSCCGIQSYPYLTHIHVLSLSVSLSRAHHYAPQTSLITHRRPKVCYPHRSSQLANRLQDMRELYSVFSAKGCSLKQGLNAQKRKEWGEAEWLAVSVPVDLWLSTWMASEVAVMTPSMAQSSDPRRLLYTENLGYFGL